MKSFNGYPGRLTDSLAQQNKLLTQQHQTPSRLLHCKSRRLQDYLPQQKDCVLIVDENIARLYPQVITGYPSIHIRANEASKSLSNVETICQTLLQLKAHRKTMLTG